MENQPAEINKRESKEPSEPKIEKQYSFTELVQIARPRAKLILSVAAGNKFINDKTIKDKKAEDEQEGINKAYYCRKDNVCVPAEPKMNVKVRFSEKAINAVSCFITMVAKEIIDFGFEKATVKERENTSKIVRNSFITQVNQEDKEIYEEFRCTTAGKILDALADEYFDWDSLNIEEEQQLKRSEDEDEDEDKDIHYGTTFQSAKFKNFIEKIIGNAKFPFEQKKRPRVQTAFRATVSEHLASLVFRIGDIICKWADVGLLGRPETVAEKEDRKRKKEAKESQRNAEIAAKKAADPSYEPTSKEKKPISIKRTHQQTTVSDNHIYMILASIFIPMSCQTYVEMIDYIKNFISEQCEKKKEKETKTKTTTNAPKKPVEVTPAAPAVTAPVPVPTRRRTGGGRGRVRK